MKIRIKLLGGLALILTVVLGTIVSIGAAQNNEAHERIESTVKQAQLLSIGQRCVVDEHGNLLENCCEDYESKLHEVYTDESGYIQQYFEIMQTVYNTFDASTDVVLENQITDFSIQKLDSNGTNAVIVCDFEIVQKYIKSHEDSEYRVIFASSHERKHYTLKLGDDDRWRVVSESTESYEFGSPVEMGLATENYEEVFPSRQAACEYANSLSIEERFCNKNP